MLRSHRMMSFVGIGLELACSLRHEPYSPHFLESISRAYLFSGMYCDRFTTPRGYCWTWCTRVWPEQELSKVIQTRARSHVNHEDTLIPNAIARLVGSFWNQFHSIGENRPIG